MTTYVGQVTGTTSATLPAHQAGDLILGFAFRDGSTTAPTVPSGVNWSSLYSSNGANTCSHSVAYKIATSSGETTGTFTNASSVVFLVYRPGSGKALTVGAHQSGSGSSSSVSYTALTLQGASNTSWVAGFAGHRSTNTTLETAPTGMINRATVSDATDEAAGHDTNGTVSSWSTQTVSVGGTASGWRSHTVEVLEYGPPSISAHPSNSAKPVGGTATFSVTATGSGTLTYQWQENDNNAGWVNAVGGTGATTSSYTTPKLTHLHDGYQYRCVVSNAAGSVNSNGAAITVGARLYFVLYASTGGTPSVAQVKAGQDSTGAAAIASGVELADLFDEQQVFTTAVTGLTEGNSYKVALVWSDGTSDSTVAESGSFVPGGAYLYTGSGGAVTGGAATTVGPVAIEINGGGNFPTSDEVAALVHEYVYITSGGTTSGGASTTMKSVLFSYVGSGSASSAGDPPHARDKAYKGVGTVSTSGSAVTEKTKIFVASGAASASGAAITFKTTLWVYVTSGLAQTSGAAQAIKVKVFTTTGGVLASGAATVVPPASTRTYTASGGGVSGGVAPHGFTKVVVGAGVSTTAGSSPVSTEKIFDTSTSGGLALSGAAASSFGSSSSNSYLGSGVVSTSGGASTLKTKEHLPSGSVALTGQSLVSTIKVAAGSGSIAASGSSLVSLGKVFAGSGSITTSGNAASSLNGNIAPYTGSGGAGISGAAQTSVVNLLYKEVVGSGGLGTGGAVSYGKETGFRYLGDGRAISSGSASVFKIKTLLPSGGVGLGGLAFTEGVVSYNTFEYSPVGGFAINGTAPRYRYLYNPDMVATPVYSTIQETTVKNTENW